MSKPVISDGQLLKFRSLAEQKGVTPRKIQIMLECGIIADIFDPAADFCNRDAWRFSLGLPALNFQVTLLTVDYNQLLEDNLDPYDYYESDVDGMIFRVLGRGKVTFEARYFHFNQTMSTPDILAKIRGEDPEQPWRPAEYEHLLVHGQVNPLEHFKYPVAALGSVFTGDWWKGQEVLIIRKGNPVNTKYQRLRRRSTKTAWAPNYRFLAVREVEQ